MTLGRKSCAPLVYNIYVSALGPVYRSHLHTFLFKFRRKRKRHSGSV